MAGPISSFLSGIWPQLAHIYEYRFYSHPPSRLLVARCLLFITITTTSIIPTLPVPILSSKLAVPCWLPEISIFCPISFAQLRAHKPEILVSFFAFSLSSLLLISAGLLAHAFRPGIAMQVQSETCSVATNSLDGTSQIAAIVFVGHHSFFVCKTLFSILHRSALVGTASWLLQPSSDPCPHIQFPHHAFDRSSSNVL